jgi:pimeloyl-ACP methyl ester carboxylesterase
MPMFKRADADIHYEVHGSGFPILLYAPGGLKSQMEMWGGVSPAYPNGFPWMDPRKALSDKFTVIAMDQRNAGRSIADVKPDHGWHTFAGDHFALMDHLGFDKFFVMGGCIGGSYCFEAIEQNAARIPAAVLQNPIGLWENRDTWDEAVKGYSATVRGRDPSISEETIQSFGKNMFGSDFVFSVTRDFVKACKTPLFLQPGTDKPHPAKTSEEIAALAPNIEVQKDWKGPTYLDQSIKRVRAFLERNTPKA